MTRLRSHVTARTWGALALAGVAVYLAIPPRDGCACGTPATARTPLKNALGTVAEQQEEFLVDSGRYTTSLERLRLDGGPAIALSIDSVTATGFRAQSWYRDPQSTNEARAGRCVIWVGDASLAIATVPEGRALCWVPRRPRWRFGRFGPPEPVMQ